MFNIPFTQDIFKKNGYTIIDTDTPYAKGCIKEFPESYHIILFADNYSGFLKSKKSVELLKEQLTQELHKRFYNKKIEILFIMKAGENTYINISKEDNTIIINKKGKCVVRGDIDKTFTEEMQLIKLSKTIGCKTQKKEALESKIGIDYGYFGIYLLIMYSIYVYFVTYENNQQYAIGIIETLKNNSFYTLITYMFMHNSIIHLISNCICLFFIGRHVENSLGIIKTYTIYILGGIYAGIVSCIYKLVTNETAYTIGSSGSIFSILGAYSVLAIKYSENKRAALAKTGTYAISLIGIGFLNPMTDNACHVGGFLAGIIITLCILMAEEMANALKVNRLLKDIIKTEKKIYARRT